MKLLLTFFISLAAIELITQPIVFAAESTNAYQAHSPIKLNQIGYTAAAKKLAIVPASGAKQFDVISVKTGKSVLSGSLSQAKTWAYSDESVKQADFSALHEHGSYRISVDKVGESYPFEITDSPLVDVHKASIKAFYHNRSGTETTPQYAGEHARIAGHLDTQVMVHKSAASKERPEGSVLSSAKGWYDAGDYGKYVVNSGISTYTLLLAYQQHKELYQDLALGIPESGNDVPDLLDEIKWNLDWLVTMQDLDGGVYHKVTPLQFAQMVAPSKDTQQRYFIGKSVTAALDFAAVMSVAHRVFSEFESQFPGVSNEYLLRAQRAYQWARANPSALYKQPRDVGTGAYGDKDANDEFSWAAAELFLSTGDQDYFKDFESRKTSASANLSWPSVAALGFISLSHSGKGLLSDDQLKKVNQELISAADQHYSNYMDSAYAVPATKVDFVWGSNGDILNNGIVIAQAYRISGDRKYLDAAMATVNYVMGKNATGYSFVTGFGDKTPMNIHHRPSVADGVVNPVPGFLAGGPQNGKQDRCQYIDSTPAKTYSDTVCSYSTNEIAINWNAPLVYMLGMAVNNR